jgi:hypothetical protein
MLGYRLQQANRIAMVQFKRRCNTYECYWRWFTTTEKIQAYTREMGILRKTRKLCSCWMCGHRRRYEGPTMNERRQI